MQLMIANLIRHGLRLQSVHFGLVATVVVICTMVVSFDGWHTWEARTTAMSADKVETANLARSLAQHTHDMIQATDTVLVSIRGRLEIDPLSQGGSERLHRRMLQIVAALPFIHGLFVYDAAGAWLVNSTSLPANSSLNNSDRDYFKYHRSHPDTGVHIGAPVISKSDGTWIVTLSRRIDKDDGAFGGVVLATVSISSMQQYYATFDIGRLGAITLLSQDGLIIAREPPDDIAIGTDLSRSQVFREFLPRSPVGSFEAVYSVDGVTRIGSYRRVDDYPLVIVVAHGLDSVLAEWRKAARLHFIISIGSALMLATLGIRFAAEMRKTQKAERRYRLLADNSSDAIICIGRDGRRLYASPAFTTLTGWTVQEGMERPWDSFVHPDDLPDLLGINAKLTAGAGPVTCTVRYRCSDGLYRWAEARVQLLDRVDHEESQFVANVRDITERKLVEDQVAALNREIALQAATDSLTGLANRRRFDETLTLEWRRAGREQLPLSLVMIDVDRFKLYNDRYGHQQGDRCLRTVGAAIRGFARRAGDMAARYGGEEFVILLPTTDAIAAAEVAEAICAAIQDIGIEHADNPPLGVVTASIGVATLIPQSDDPEHDPHALMSIADAALYGAKGAGRNRVVAPSANQAASFLTIPAMP
jgi:diguanylate cyclase (GGDEF)-like protein/PAS domain S-box-containing protein